MGGKMRRNIFLVIAFLMLFLPCFGGKAVKAAERPKIGIAWMADTDSVCFTDIWCAIEQAGGHPVLLPQVKSPDLSYDGTKLLPIQVDKNTFLKSAAAKIIKLKGYEGSNAAKVAAGVKAVIFAGGEDVSPTLLAKEEPWHGIMADRNYNAERDVSDYILMRYCLDNDIPVLGVCRGLQIMSMACGATVIQDIPTYMAGKGKEYNYLHRRREATSDGNGDYMPHEVKLVPDSLASDIFDTLHLEGVPSWHHQAVRSVEGTPLKVTGITMTDVEPIIEIVELPENTFAIGVQFHPEAAITKVLEAKANRNEFMNFKDSVKIFRELVKAAERN